MSTNHGTYRITRTVISIIHIIIQLMIMWNLYAIIMPLTGISGEDNFILLTRILINLGIIIGLFSIYYSLNKLLSRGQLSSHERRK